jgi:hypothetical protein
MALFAFLAWSFQLYDHIAVFDRTFLIHLANSECCIRLLLILIAFWSCSSHHSQKLKPYIGKYFGPSGGKCECGKFEVRDVGYYKGLFT